MRTPVYGLTGGIASGKSTVLAQFAALGIETLDTDQLARDVIAQGTSGALQLETAIGSEYFQDGCLDRARLRSDMYQSAHLKKTVEGIIHPLVRNAVNQWLDQQPGSPYRILCSPLLIETNQHAMAGIESTAKITSENSMTSKTMNNGVMKNFPLSTIKNFEPIFRG